MTQRRWGARELVAAGLAWLTGLASLHRCERLPNGGEYAALVVAALLLFALRRRHWLALAGCVAVLAFTQAALRAEWRLTPKLHPAWEGRDLTLAGRVDSLPIAVTGQGGVPGWRFEFAVESVGPTGTALPPEVPRRLMLLSYDGPPITAGERWRFTARVARRALLQRLATEFAAIGGGFCSDPRLPWGHLKSGQHQLIHRRAR